MLKNEKKGGCSSLRTTPKKTQLSNFSKFMNIGSTADENDFLLMQNLKRRPTDHFEFDFQIILSEVVSIAKKVLKYLPPLFLEFVKEELASLHIVWKLLKMTNLN